MVLPFLIGFLNFVLILAQENITSTEEPIEEGLVVSTAQYDNETEFGFTEYKTPSHVLNLTNCNLESLEDNDWHFKADDIIVIDASYNPIETIGILHSNTLREINVSYGELRWIREGSLRGVPHLEKFIVHNNKHLTTLEMAAPSLIYLDASHCSISDVVMGRLVNLKWLNLSFNRITTISSDFFPNNTQLLELNLSHNDIQFIDEYAFIKVTHLQKLDLSWNAITATDWSITLKSALLLDISHNQIDSIDVLFLRYVKTLKVSHNNLQNLPDDIQRLLPNLQEIDAAANPIRKLRRIKSSRLTVINLKECKIDEVAKDCFSETPSLSLVDLSDNKITSLNFLLSIRNGTAAVLDLNPWECTCNLSIAVALLCQPSNLSLADYCSMMAQLDADDSQWWFEAASNPVIWAPLVVACVILVVACFGIGTYRRRMLIRNRSNSVDLIRNTNTPELDVRVRKPYEKLLKEGYHPVATQSLKRNLLEHNP